jgi:ATP-binding cassette subfamily F protein uup
MAVLLSCSEIAKAFGSRVLFNNLSLTISDGDRIGLIGPNGSGKTTLLEILAGNDDPDSGTRAVRQLTRVAYVPQDSQFGDEDTVGSVLVGAVAKLPLEDAEKDARVQAMFGRAGFQDTATRAAALSGGWKKRLAIAAALITLPDLLILDEPTNHLDLDGILWLENAVTAANACLVVTHDRYFLENVSTRVVEINRAYPQGIFQVNGNYSEFLERREEFLEVQDRQRAALATQVRREVDWLRRGPKARTGKSRARISSAGQLIEQFADANERNRSGIAQIEFTATDRKTKRLIEAEGIGKSLGRPLFRNLNVTLSPGVRIGLVGANGSGKTTLLKLLEGLLQPDEGTIRRADRLRIVVFAQDRAIHLDPQVSLRRTLCPDGDMVLYRDRLIHVAGWAKRFLFRSDQLDMPVSKLSGGERARVAIAKLMLTPADVLLLDEPTNDLDIPTLEALEENLLEFAGAVVLVSHDRYLLDRVSTTVLALDGGSAQAFADYSQWEAWRQETVSEKPVGVKEARPAPPPASAPKKLSYMEQREWDAMEGQILEAETEVARWQSQLEEPSGDGKNLADAYEKLQAAQQRVAQLYERWADLEAKLAR